MRAIRVAEWGGPFVVTDVDPPARRPGTTRVEVRAATVGHVDRTIWSGAFLRHPPLPYTPGVEAAGVVVDSDVFAPGDRVWIRGGGLGTATDGTWAEKVDAPDGALGHLPDGVPFPIGSAFFSPCTSAWVALHSIAGVRSGQTVCITGATGAVGSIAVQLALDAGADVVAVVSNAERMALLPDGVTAVTAAQLAGATADDATHRPIDGPVDVLIDTVGGPVLANALTAVTPGGVAVLVGYVAGPTIEIDLPTFMQRDVSLHPLNMIRREPEGRAAAPELLDRLAAGTLRLDVTEFALGDAADAVAWLTAGGHVGRAVLVPGAAP
jgi:NADPH2:quinone reductase